MNNFYTYIYLDQDGIPFYVGKGKDKRYYVSMHLGKNVTNPFLKNKIKKVGVNNIKIQFLHENLTEKEAFQQERYWIKHYGRRDLGTGTLCNLTDGGEGASGHIHSKESRQKMAFIQKDRVITDVHKKKISATLKGNIPWNKGVSCSNDQKKRISVTMCGRTLPTEVREKISEAMQGGNHPMYGKFHSKETKQKMRDAWKRRKSLFKELK